MQNQQDIRSVLEIHNESNYCKAKQQVLSLGYSQGVYFKNGSPISDEEAENMHKFDNTNYQQRQSCVDNIDGKSNWYTNGNH